MTDQLKYLSRVKNSMLERKEQVFIIFLSIWQMGIGTEV